VKTCQKCGSVFNDNIDFCVGCGEKLKSSDIFADTYDIFLSYRRDGGEAMAILLYDQLTARGYKVFLDIENLNSGTFNKKLFDVIDGCKDFVLICSKDSLNRCINDGDWVRMEIAHALNNEKNIVPVMLRGFVFPDVLPDDIEAVRMHNGVNANSHEYFDAAIDRLASKFLISRPKVTLPPPPPQYPYYQQYATQPQPQPAPTPKIAPPKIKLPKLSKPKITLKKPPKAVLIAVTSIVIVIIVIFGIVSNIPIKVKVGDIIQFGGYDWHVLKVKDESALIISDKILEKREYNKEWVSVTWETCTLRAYLNGDFYDSFSETDKKRIIRTTNENPDNPEHEIDGGNDTDDYIFLLSIDEVNKYFKNDSARNVDFTWWLRSPGINFNFAVLVLGGGRVSVDGTNVNGTCGVRPALWIKLD